MTPIYIHPRTFVDVAIASSVATGGAQTRLDTFDRDQWRHLLDMCLYASYGDGGTHFSGVTEDNVPWTVWMRDAPTLCADD